MTKTYRYDRQKELNQNSVILSRILKDERAGLTAKGFRFHFGQGEYTTHKRYCSALENDVREMVRMARETKRDVSFYPNLNGELSVELSAPMLPVCQCGHGQHLHAAEFGSHCTIKGCPCGHFSIAQSVGSGGKGETR